MYYYTTRFKSRRKNAEVQKTQRESSNAFSTIPQARHNNNKAKMASMEIRSELPTTRKAGKLFEPALDENKNYEMKVFVNSNLSFIMHTSPACSREVAQLSVSSWT